MKPLNPAQDAMGRFVTITLCLDAVDDFPGPADEKQALLLSFLREERLAALDTLRQAMKPTKTPKVGQVIHMHRQDCR